MMAVLLTAAVFGFTLLESPAQGGSKISATAHRAAAAAAVSLKALRASKAEAAAEARAKRVTRAATTTTVPVTATTSPVTATTSPPTTTPTIASDPPTSTASTGKATAGPTIGVSIPSLISQTPATQAAWLANLKGIGITSIRIGADWAWVQYAGPTTYDWSQLDQQIAAVRAAGMTVDLVITGCPPWAAVSGAAGRLSPQPADPAAFATFAAAVAARYAPQGVTDFEIWNEPNNVGFWQPAPNPAAYTALLRASYASIKAADPSAFVITGGLAPESNDGTNINAVTFLSDMYADGARGSFDALGYHPYSYPALPNTYELWSGWSQMSQTPSSIEGVLSANGDASKPLWLTELGAPTSGPDGVGMAAQAQELTQAIADAKATSWMGALYIYTYEDSGSDPTTNEDWFGLLNADGSPKPAFAAVAAALK